MKVIMALSCLLALAAGQETYTSENDDLDIDALVASPESLRAWAGCFIDRSPCDKVQGSFKVDFPEAVQQACAKCTPAQKVIVRKFLAGLKASVPDDYALFSKKYDPENKYFEPLLKAVSAGS